MNDFIKARVYDQIQRHLKSKLEDPRPRERQRTRLALKIISKWYKEEEEKYGTSEPK